MQQKQELEYKQKIDAILIPVLGADNYTAEVDLSLDFSQQEQTLKTYNPDLPAVRAVGYRQAWEFLDGQGDARDFRERAIAATRQLAKRQLTWLRGELDARWFDPATDAARLAQAQALFLPRG